MIWTSVMIWTFVMLWTFVKLWTFVIIWTFVIWTFVMIWTLRNKVYNCMSIFFLLDSLCPSQQCFSCQDGSSWVEPVLSRDLYVLLKDTIQC